MRLWRLSRLFLLVCALIGGIGLESVAAVDFGLMSAGLGDQVSALARIWPDEPYSQVFTDEMAEEIAVWVLDAYPELPFRDPQVEIHEDGIVCNGVVEILGVDVAVSGRVSVFVEDGVLNGRLEEIEMAGVKLPGLLMGAIDDARRLYESATWEVVVTNVELREGEMLVEGEYRE